MGTKVIFYFRFNIGRKKPGGQARHELVASPFFVPKGLRRTGKVAVSATAKQKLVDQGIGERK